jgi:hypothetical protein
MGKYNREQILRLATNVATDVGVLAQGSNTALNWEGGAPAIAFNLAALAICAGLRLRAELAKNDSPAIGKPATLLRRALDNPRTSLIAASAAQLVACVVLSRQMDITQTQTIRDAVIPGIIALGDAVAVYDSTKVKSKLARIVLNPINYFATSLIIAGSAWVPGAIFIAAAGVSTRRAIQANDAGPDPFTMMAVGSEVAAVLNWPDPVLSPVFAVVGGCYLSMKATIEHGGVFEALQASPKIIRGNLSKIAAFIPR